jgi:hypothetical protein
MTQARLARADEDNMASFNLVKHRPGQALPVLLFSVMAAVAISRLIGTHLVPALIQLSPGR